MLALYRTLSLRHLRRRASRAVLIVASIALGVATLVSSQALNRSMGAAARAAAAPLGGAADLVVSNGAAGTLRALAAELRAVPGLRSVQPLVIERVQLADLNGRIALLLGIEAADAPAADFGVSVQVTRPAALLAPLPVLVGRYLAAELPDGPIRVRVAGEVRELAPLGTVTLTGPAADLGRTLLVLDLDRAAKLFGRPHLASRIDLFLRPDVDPAAVREAVRAAVGTRASVETPDAHGRAVQDVIAGVQVGFALCGAGALVVGMFLVYNALAVSVAERRHDIGILRSLGATRGQVAALFAGEAVALGLVGALAGLPLGVGLARLALGPMRQVLSEIFLAVEAREVRWEPATLLGALAAGVLTALLAALVPALQAAADEPADAVRRAPSGAARLFRVLQGAASLLLVAAGVSMAVFRAALPPRLGGYGGLILMLLGALLSTPLVVAAAARLVRPLARLALGVEERLAADNLLRAPGRTGVVIGALAAGVAMTVQIAGVGESNEAPVVTWIDRSLTADLYVMGGAAANSTSSNLPLTPALAAELRGLPGVREVVPVRFRRPDFRDTVVLVVAFDARRFYAANAGLPDYPDLDLFPRLAEPGTALVSDNFAALHRVVPGDTIALPGVRGPVTLRVVGTIEDYSWSRGTVFIDRATQWQVFEDDRVDIFDIFLAAGGPGESAVRDFAARRALFVMTRADLRGYIIDVIRRLYALVQVQQLVVGLVGALGVVTALLVSVLQRQRELGLLRAVGASRGQVLRTVLAEAALMGLIGTLFGLAIGVPMQWYMIRIVLWEESGFLFPLVVPWRAALGVAAVALLVSTLAGLAPALHAARLRITEAIAYE